MIEIYLEFPPGLRNHPVDILRVLLPGGHRFFNDHVAAGFEGINHRGFMVLVGRGHIDRIELLLLQHILIAGVRRRHLQLGGGFRQVLLRKVRERGHFHVLDQLKNPGARLTHDARSDNVHLKCHSLPPGDWG